MELGFKWVMAEQDDWMPMSTLVTRLNVPVGSSEASAGEVEPGFSYIYNWQVRRWWFIRGCTGFDWYNAPEYRFATAGGVPTVPTQLLVDHDQYLEFSQAISSYMQVSKRVGMFAEWFMFKRHGSEDDHSDHFHNYGIYLYLTPDIQIDGRFGWRIGDYYEETLLGLGLSFRY